MQLIGIQHLELELRSRLLRKALERCELEPCLDMYGHTVNYSTYKSYGKFSAKTHLEIWIDSNNNPRLLIKHAKHEVAVGTPNVGHGFPLERVLSDKVRSNAIPLPITAPLSVDIHSKYAQWSFFPWLEPLEYLVQRRPLRRAADDGFALFFTSSSISTSSFRRHR